MKRIQRKTERRISAALRLALVALLLLLQIALVIVLVQVLRQKMYIGYTVLQMLGVLCVLHLYMRPGSSTYKPGWIILIMLVPVVGLILYFLWQSGEKEAGTEGDGYAEGVPGGAGEQHPGTGGADRAVAPVGQAYGVFAAAEFSSVFQYGNDIFSNG